MDKFVQPMKMNAVIGIFSGVFLALCAYIGFEGMVNLAEEMKNPRRVLPHCYSAGLNSR